MKRSVLLVTGLLVSITSFSQTLTGVDLTPREVYQKAGDTLFSFSIPQLAEISKIMILYRGNEDLIKYYEQELSARQNASLICDSVIKAKDDRIINYEKIVIKEKEINEANSMIIEEQGRIIKRQKRFMIGGGAGAALLILLLII